MLILIAILFGIAFTGLTAVLMHALRDGMSRYADVYSEETARGFEDVFLFIPPKRIAELGWAAAVAVFLIVIVMLGRFARAQDAILTLLFAASCGAATLRAPTLLLRILRARRLQRFNEQLGDTLVSMSNALKAGFSITQAFESVVREGEKPIAQEFGVFLQQTRIGVAFGDALDNMQKRVGSEDLKLVVVAIDTARKTGGNLTEIFEQIAATIRERLRIERRIRTLTAQGRLQGLIVSLMPVFIGIALLVVDPEMMVPFLHSSMGLVMMIIVAILITLGGLVIRRIVRIDV